MKKLLSLTTILACASCLGAYASEADFLRYIDSDSEVNSGGSVVVSIGGFYGVAVQDLYSDIDKIDIYGMKVSFDFPAFPLTNQGVSSIINQGAIWVDPFVEVMFGYGDSSEDLEYEGKTDFTIMHSNVAAGVRWRFQLTEMFALTANAKIGLDVEYMEIDADYWVKEDKTALGFLWGAGVAAELYFCRNVGIFAGVDYVGSTAKPDFDYYMEPDSQSYFLFSGGLVFRF